jgi:hypothetical protein
MKKLWNTIAGYIWWTYPRGSVHYDVMVTLILAFIFLAPLKINFKDKPQERPPQLIRIVVMSDPAGGAGFVYRVDAGAVHGSSDADIRDSLIGVIGQVNPNVEITRWEPVKDAKGHIAEYKVWVPPQR